MTGRPVKCAKCVLEGLCKGVGGTCMQEVSSTSCHAVTRSPLVPLRACVLASACSSQCAQCLVSTCTCLQLCLGCPYWVPACCLQKFTPESVDFQNKILARSGLGDQTYLPPGLAEQPPAITMKDARAEFEQVCAMTSAPWPPPTCTRKQELLIGTRQCRTVLLHQARRSS